jgi:hypothetical protein
VLLRITETFYRVDILRISSWIFEQVDKEKERLVVQGKVISNEEATR